MTDRRPRISTKALNSTDLTVAKGSTLAAATLALLLGAFIVLGTGFAHSDIIHNAAHDARHAFAFPCH